MVVLSPIISYFEPNLNISLYPLSSNLKLQGYDIKGYLKFTIWGTSYQIFVNLKQNV